MKILVAPLCRSKLDGFVELCRRTFTIDVYNRFYRDKVFKEGDVEEWIAVAESDGRLVGGLYIFKDQDVLTGQPIVFIWGAGWSPWVDPGFQDRGVEDALVNYVVELCRRWGIFSVRITSWVRILQRRHYQMVSCFLRNGFTLDWSALNLVKLIREEDRSFESTLSFRTIDEVGSETFLKLMVESYEGAVERCFTKETLAREAPKWIKEETFDPSLWIAAYLNDEPIGTCVSRLKPYPNIDFIGVLLKHRRKGFGTQLMKRTIACLAEKGAKRVFLGVDEMNIPAVKLYEKLGFFTIRVTESLTLS